MKQLKPSMQFTDLCAMLLRELHEVEGKGEEEVREAMKLMPFVSPIKRCDDDAVQPERADMTIVDGTTPASTQR